MMAVQYSSSSTLISFYYYLLLLLLLTSSTVLGKSKTHFDVKIDVGCGNLDVTGNVILREDPLYGSGKSITTWKITRDDKNVVHHKGNHEMNVKTAKHFEVIIETECGIISPIGKYCINEFTFKMFKDPHSNDVFLHTADPVDFYMVLLNGQNDVQHKTKCY